MERITDDDNLWFNAIKLEDAGKYSEAFVYYLKDSAECLKQNALVKAALSCSCAAICLSYDGNLAAARRLYLEAARIYEDNADFIIGESIRESLWSLQEAYEYYLLGGDNDKADKVYNKTLFLSRKVNPFSHDEEIMQKMKLRKKQIEDTANVAHANLQSSYQIEEEIQKFMRLRNPNSTIDNIIDNTFKNNQGRQHS
jgi:tetratricopeptide (TPR) repeat protein